MGTLLLVIPFDPIYILLSTPLLVKENEDTSKWWFHMYSLWFQVRTSEKFIRNT